jgi:hypothetical protein
LRLLCEAGLLREAVLRILRDALLLLPHSSDSWCVECNRWLVRLQEMRVLLDLLDLRRSDLCRMRRVWCVWR